MYDGLLYRDVVTFKSGAETIDEVKNRFEYINKVIENRTKDKIWFLEYILSKKVINIEKYEKLKEMVKEDYSRSKLFVLGLIIESEL